MTTEFEVVVPAYNEEKSLSHLIDGYANAAKAAGFDPSSFQLVIVNNGSTDNSAETLAELSKSPSGKWFRTVHIVKNIGYGHGIHSGLLETKASIVGYSHADEQCAPEDTFRAREKLKNKETKSIVKGVRSRRNWKDIFVSRTFELLAKLILGTHAYEINAQPKVFPRSLLNELRNPPVHFAFDLYVLYQAEKNNYSTVDVPVEFPPRVHGVSRWAATFFSRFKTIFGQIKYMWLLLKLEGRIANKSHSV